MSLEASRWAWGQSISPTEKLVLLALADHANKANQCWPSLRRIEARTGLARSTVAANLNSLEANGFLGRQRSTGRSSTRYFLNITRNLCAELPEAHVSFSETVSEADCSSSSSGPQRSGEQTATVRQPDPNQSRISKEPKLKPTCGVSRSNEKDRQGMCPAPTENLASARLGGINAVGEAFNADPDHLPEWLPASLWREFVEHRAQLQAPMTKIAQKHALSALEALRQRGEDVATVISQSIAHGWKGLFATGETRRGKTASERRGEATAEALKQI